MEKTISEIFDNYIQIHYPNVKPIAIKKQTYGQKPLEDVLRSLMLQQYKKNGYYQ